MNTTLRNYQVNAIDTIRAKIASGKKRILLVLATGAGKTNIAAEIVKLATNKGKKSLFVAHKRELVYQAHDRLAGFGIDAGLIMPPRSSMNRHSAHVASIQTLIRREHPPADIVFLDECFPAGSFVDNRKIECLKTGDYVCSFNHKKNTIEKKKILKTMVRKYEGSWVKIKTSSGKEIVCTEEHPIYIVGNGYIHANKLLCLHGASVMITNYEMSLLPKTNAGKNISTKVLFKYIAKNNYYTAKIRSYLQILRQNMRWVGKTETSIGCKMPILSSVDNQTKITKNPFVQILQLQMQWVGKKETYTTNKLQLLQFTNTNKNIKQNKIIQILQYAMRCKRKKRNNIEKEIATNKLSCLWKNICCKIENTPFIVCPKRAWILFRKMYENIYENNKFVDNEKHQSEIQKYYFRQNEKQESNVRPKGKGENDCIYARENIPIQWWQRKINETTIKNTRTNRIANGICNKYFFGKKQIQKSSKLLQSGYSRSISIFSNRNRWTNTSIKKMEIPGQKKNRDFKFDRLESVEIYKPGSRQRPEWVPVENTVYNIHVEDNNNYFANNILVHNCHHCTSPSFTKIINHYKDSVIIGLTATPFRMDGKPLGDIFEETVTPTTIQELIDMEFLVQPRYFGAKIDLSRIKVVRGDYDPSQLFETMDKNFLYDGVVEKFKEFGSGRTIVFCINIKHSQKTTAAFVAAGYKAAHIDFETSNEERKRLLSEFKKGNIQILSNCGIFSEGFDCPSINTVILNKATKSKGTYFQMVGRALRPDENKTHCTVIDHGNNVRDHLPVEWFQAEIDCIKKRKSVSMEEEREGQIKECVKCKSLISVQTRTCPFCGYIFAENKIELIEAKFEELNFDKIKPKIVIPAHLRKRWIEMNDDELEEYRVLKNYKKGWVFHQKRLKIEEELKNQEKCYV